MLLAERSEAPASLESGDHLTREEFHRRYCTRPDIKKAELVEGIVYVGGRVRVEHGESHARMVWWLGLYAAYAPDVHCGDSATVILDERNELQPDAIIWLAAPGGPRLNEDDYIEGAPQLVVEVAASSVSYDLHEKKEAYRRNCVHEYVVWRVLDEAIDWFRLRGGQYILIEPDASGIVESEQFPGLRLHVLSMLAGDLTAVLAHLRGTA